MIRVEKLQAYHVLELEGIDAACGVNPLWLDPDYADELEDCGGFAAIDDEGTAVGIGGFIYPHHTECAVAWAILGRRWRRHARTISDIVRAEIVTLPARRVECHVLADFKGGHAWAQALGMQREGVQRAAWIDGRDVVVYARIREEPSWRH